MNNFWEEKKQGKGPVLMVGVQTFDTHLAQLFVLFLDFLISRTTFHTQYVVWIVFAVFLNKRRKSKSRKSIRKALLMAHNGTPLFQAMI